ncbi:MAG: Clp protease ClpP, partial [Alphaproteobacteria bacterium]|nr:Clp protease ClpP [Alphaproteobacteria bacterium]
MVDVYAARTGGDAADIAQMMDRETWIPGSQAVEKGFADAFLASDSITQGEPDPATTSAAAAHRIDTLLARAGVSRTRRRELIREVKSGTPGAADPATQNAGNPDLREALAQLKDLNIPTFGD